MFGKGEWLCPSHHVTSDVMAVGRERQFTDVVSIFQSRCSSNSLLNRARLIKSNIADDIRGGKLSSVGSECLNDLGMLE